jgi:hypothetical protein
MMIEQFNESGLVFPTPDSIKLESEMYIQAEDWLEEFLDTHCDKRAEGKVKLTHLFQLLYPDPNRIPLSMLKKCKSKQHLRSQLTSKDYYTIKTNSGIVVHGLAVKPEYVNCLTGDLTIAD